MPRHPKVRVLLKMDDVDSKASEADLDLLFNVDDVFNPDRCRGRLLAPHRSRVIVYDGDPSAAAARKRIEKRMTNPMRESLTKIV